MPLSKRRSALRGRLGRRRRTTNSEPSFVIQQRAAGSDYYDFRLEIDGVLVSWAMAGPSMNPKDRRMARRIEDHPLQLPEAGDAVVWDRGSYINATGRDMGECLNRGHLSFWLQGEKLCSGFTLTRIRAGKDETWLLIKRKDDGADPRRTLVKSQPEPPMYSDALDDLAESS
ncbi:DNA polymerase ligase N-terminal domain-containing protein [Mycobacterium stomatepiae]|uniref:DNA ligase D 3'-phosphoesterase domain-containing protein n=1 Tax=Mycobacterium stomatepiae TaxID=470076 RepID=A0A7I7Q3C7_9MYCO|nr:DNA ligase [Mycobacterium stomatepiae]BBY20865.1 hypothetical protein MSTO_10700 [Mycobacterium stomatepiae]